MAPWGTCSRSRGLRTRGANRQAGAGAPHTSIGSCPVAERRHVRRSTRPTLSASTSRRISLLALSKPGLWQHGNIRIAVPATRQAHVNSPGVTILKQRDPTATCCWKYCQCSELFSRRQHRLPRNAIVALWPHADFPSVRARCVDRESRCNTTYLDQNAGLSRSAKCASVRMRPSFPGYPDVIDRSRRRRSSPGA